MQKKVKENPNVDKPKKSSEKKREYNHRYYIKHKDQVKELCMKYRNDNREKIRENQKKYDKSKRLKFHRLENEVVLLKEKLRELGYEEFVNEIEAC